MRAKNRFLPSYSILPVAVLLIVWLMVYYLPKILTDGGHHFDISLPIDQQIPFIPAFIVIYIMSYIQWFVGYLLIAREEKDFAYRIFSSAIIAKLICLTIYLLVPTIMVRPEVTGTDVFSRLTAFIYSIDTPTTLFPSLHCLESWLFFRASFHFKRVGRWVVWAWAVFALLVFLTVLFVKQHLILDIPAAILVGEIALYIGKKFKTERFFYKLHRLLTGKGQD